MNYSIQVNKIYSTGRELSGTDIIYYQLIEQIKQMLIHQLMLASQLNIIYY